MAFTKITAAGIGSTETVTLDGLSVINDGSFGGNVSVGGTLTYEDVTNIDSVGLITARAGVNVGSGITLSKDGDIFATGVTTSTTFVGNLTGAATQVTVADESSDTSCNVLYTTAASGNLAPKSGTNLTFNSSSGALTATSFVGSGANLTGVASTENIRTNTNATFLQNINVSGTVTATSYAGDGSSLTGVGKTVAEGGDVTYSYESGGKNYMIHIFSSTGFSGVFRTNKAMSIDFLLVGGGGGSAGGETNYGASGGGGAGGLVEGSGFSLSAGSYVVTVGAGGAATNATTFGGTGGDSTFAGVTAKGGGGGADYASTGGTGGNGGGGSEPNTAGGSSNQSSQNAGISNITQYGNAGGQGGEYTADPTGGGGGGGAGGAGGTAAAAGNGVGGARGAGRANSITGTSVTYAIGGRGGKSNRQDGYPGEDNLGHGADGASANVSSTGEGARGGNGVCIIKYEV